MYLLGFFHEGDTNDSAAKWNITSGLDSLIKSDVDKGSVRSQSINVIFDMICFTFSKGLKCHLLLAYILQSGNLLIIKSAMWEPTKPVIPVIRIDFGSDSLFKALFPARRTIQFYTNEAHVSQ